MRRVVRIVFGSWAVALVWLPALGLALVLVGVAIVAVAGFAGFDVPLGKGPTDGEFVALLAVGLAIMAAGWIGPPLSMLVGLRRRAASWHRAFAMAAVTLWPYGVEVASGLDLWGSAG